MVTATVVLCTHDRAHVVRNAVEAALGEVAACDAEVLVVDNASTDGTAAVLASMGHRGGRLRAVHEPVLGLSAARNRGLAEAAGAVAVFLDDDALPHPGWLRALLAPYGDRGVACVGGPIRVAFDAPPPPWLRPPLVQALGAYDLGDAPRRLRDRPGDEFPYGGNVSFRVEVARRVGGFSTRMGLRGRRQLQHEETDLCLRLDRSGATVAYAPNAVVDHRVPGDRLAPGWFLERFSMRGRSSAVFELRNRGLHGALGRVRWYYGAHLTVVPYAPRAPIDGDRFVRECRRREAIGYLVGLARGVVRLRALRADAVGAP